MSLFKNFTKFQAASFLGLGFGLMLILIGILVNRPSPYVILQSQYSLFKTYSTSPEFDRYYMCAFQKNGDDHVRLFCRPINASGMLLTGAFNVADDGVSTPSNPDNLIHSIRLKQFCFSKSLMSQLKIKNNNKDPEIIQFYPARVVIDRVTYNTYNIYYDGINMNASLEDPCPPAKPPTWDRTAGNQP